ncbi:MAG: protein phosphatase CheZ [Pseudomonadota bacterium]|nr:protein phosphatase CheZ [Pseudomonadota bacterium]
MSESTPDSMNQKYLAKLHRMVAHLEAGQERAFAKELDELTRERSDEVFRTVRDLAENIDERLESAWQESRIAALTERDLPTARTRLDYVIALTDQAAHRTLSLVEKGLSHVGHLTKASAEMKGDLPDGNAQDEERRQKQAETYIDEVDEVLPKLHRYLVEITEAQAFQDLTGQLIRRVVGLFEELESELSRMAGCDIDDRAHPVASGEEESIDRVDQEEVDQIIKQLGI